MKFVEAISGYRKNRNLYLTVANEIISAMEVLIVLISATYENMG